MRVVIHTGTFGHNLSLFQKALAKKRNKLLELGCLLPIHAGIHDHVRSLAAGLRRIGWHPHKETADLSDAQTYGAFVDEIIDEICVQIRSTRPDTLILTMADMWTFCDTEEKLRRFLNGISTFSDDIHAALHLDRPHIALYHHMIRQVRWGRAELGQAEQEITPQDWFAAAHRQNKEWTTATGDPRSLIHCASPTLDQLNMVALWNSILGADVVHVRGFGDHTNPESVFEDMRAFFDLPGKIGRANFEEAELNQPLPSRADVAMRMAFNANLPEVERRNSDLHFPVRLLRRRHKMLPRQGGADFSPNDVQSLTKDIPIGPWHEPNLAETPLNLPAQDAFTGTLGQTTEGLSQELINFHGQKTAWIKQRKETLRKQHDVQSDLGAKLSPDGLNLLGELGRKAYANTMTGRFVPRNIVTPDNDPSIPVRPLSVAPAAPETGALIIACIKDEAPYILEWIAYHKSIGVDQFLIFSNDCSDGSDRMLDRLAQLGHIVHEDNSVWKGKSPQQAALNKAMKMPLVKQAHWLIHIDVDEFINIRLGNGTLAEVFSQAGDDTTNITMTWRLFGNQKAEDLDGGSVLGRFTACAPNFAPKPHTMWGFKTMTKNAGLYKKLSCHRPNQPAENPHISPKWLNGSLRDITKEAAKPGTWRSSPRSIGYDAVQLNHYALRSRASYLIKRQRGRALHTDRSIGLNYWIRHDWNSYQDVSIQRHLPRMEAEKAKLLGDPMIRSLHNQGLDWHNAQIKTLKKVKEFSDLWDATKKTDLTDIERVAYALAADMES